MGRARSSILSFSPQSIQRVEKRMTGKEKAEGAAQVCFSEYSEPSRANSVIALRYEMFPVPPTMPSRTTLYDVPCHSGSGPPLLPPHVSSIKLPSLATRCVFTTSFILFPCPHSVHFDEALSIWASSAAKLHHLPPSTWVMLATLQLNRLATQKSPTRRSSSKIIRLEHVHVTLIQSWREELYASSTGMCHLSSLFCVSLDTTTVFPVQRILDFGKTSCLTLVYRDRSSLLPRSLQYWQCQNCRYGERPESQGQPIQLVVDDILHRIYPLPISRLHVEDHKSSSLGLFHHLFLVLLSLAPTNALGYSRTCD